MESNYYAFLGTGEDLTSVLGTTLKILYSRYIQILLHLHTKRKKIKSGLTQTFFLVTAIFDGEDKVLEDLVLLTT